mmetsp:Transcript_32492/g.103966  ORF Transcript_32492/g.103966 Transcript_32492/m.103966 type:complete len:293 (+) Transcript_32492:121-999(+)
MSLTMLQIMLLGQMPTDGSDVSGSDASLVARWGRHDKGADSNGMLVRSILKREYLVDLILKNEPSLQLPMGAGVDIFQFGVFTGGGMKGWVDGFRRHNHTFGHMWGFDSFQGLPDSDLAKHEPHRAKDKDWMAGGINTVDQLLPVLGEKARSYAAVRAHIIDKVGLGSERTTFVRGYYNESLPRLSRSAHGVSFQPAMLVDIDCDIYEGTIEAMEWLLSRGLLVPRTVVYYDDWQVQGEGEIKAHAELTAKYGITWKSLKPGRIHSISLWQAVSIERAPDGMGGTRKYKPCC